MVSELRQIGLCSTVQDRIGAILVEVVSRKPEVIPSPW